jgi:hypothetical protein
VISRFLTGFAALACAAAWGADIHPLDVKQGQWETTSSMQMSGMPAATIPPDILAKMPPEQRAKVEAMMAARAGKPTARTSCMTKEKMHEAWNTGQEALKTCTTTVLTSTGSKQEMRVECNRNGMKTSGTIKVEALDSEHIKGTVQMMSDDPSKSGPGMNMSYTFTSKWVGEACTETKP